MQGESHTCLAPGRAVRTLSGGEAQRLALAASLASRRSPALHVFDEPAAGLHPADVSRLIAAIHELTARGDLVVAADRRAALIAAADTRVQLHVRD